MRMVNPTRSREQRSNRAYRVFEQERWERAETRFQQEVNNGCWGRNIETNKKGKAIHKTTKRITRKQI